MISNPQSGRIIWVTGLSGSGKTTLATEITKRLKKDQANVIMLDGDELREVFGATTPGDENHGREARLQLAFQYAHLCRVLASQGMIVVVATISMFKEIHEWNRENLPGYLEVFLNVPVDELRRRDPKGIYQKFDQGEVSNVAGMDLNVDEPADADLVIHYDHALTIKAMVGVVFEKLQEKRLV